MILERTVCSLRYNASGVPGTDGTDGPAGSYPAGKGQDGTAGSRGGPAGAAALVLRGSHRTSENAYPSIL